MIWKPQLTSLISQQPYTLTIWKNAVTPEKRAHIIENLIQPTDWNNNRNLLTSNCNISLSLSLSFLNSWNLKFQVSPSLPLIINVGLLYILTLPPPPSVHHCKIKFGLYCMRSLLIIKIKTLNGKRNQLNWYWPVSQKFKSGSILIKQAQQKTTQSQ